MIDFFFNVVNINFMLNIIFMCNNDHNRGDQHHVGFLWKKKKHEKIIIGERQNMCKTVV